MAGKKPLFSADAAEEYFSTLLTYYRNTANDIFKRDNEGRHVSDQIYSAEYQKYLGMQIAMREVLEYFAKFELGDTALRQQETVTNRNEPLTLDELRKMDGEPVFAVTDRLKEWCLVHSHNSDDVIGGGIIMTRRTAEKRTYQYACYGKTWLAYRQKKEV